MRYAASLGSIALLVLPAAATGAEHTATYGPRLVFEAHGVRIPAAPKYCVRNRPCTAEMRGLRRPVPFHRGTTVTIHSSAEALDGSLRAATARGERAYGRLRRAAGGRRFFFDVPPRERREQIYLTLTLHYPNGSAAISFRLVRHLHTPFTLLPVRISSLGHEIERWPRFCRHIDGCNHVGPPSFRDALPVRRGSLIYIDPQQPVRSMWLVGFRGPPGTFHGDIPFDYPRAWGRGRGRPWIVRVPQRSPAQRIWLTVYYSHGEGSIGFRIRHVRG